MRKKSKLICGVGVNDYEGSMKIEGEDIKSYQAWGNMLIRCYDQKYQEKYPTYVGCSVCDEWLSFKNFKSWYDDNYPIELVRDLDIRFEIDKDLLISGNKVYSHENCIFLPQKVNGFMTNNKSNNTSGYTGVCWNKQHNKWQVRIQDFETGKRKHLGYFTDIEDAGKAYVKARENEVLKVKEYMTMLGYEKNVIDKIK